ncbi:Crp/Fnr family transcriptional regulator [uncultured Winogradskyella sp.]|uniref:Crp/Fnr family transcriptional regulator n=1 Tax=uncultured Winogradskyella sp. TaxID=395353 RepID=UPI00261AB328|nr:Crp/Fnr family transcriptional regulator [uncultured Winogradskyella sp.]
MVDPNFDFLKSKFHISKEVYIILQNLASKRKLRAGENIVKQGGKSKKIAFLVTGLMRAYSTLESGKQITKNIFTPINFVGAFSSLIKDKPSLLCYEALVDSVVFEVDFNQFIEISKTNIEVSNFYNRILEYVFVMYEKKQLETMALDGTQRYLSLKKQIPNIDNLIPQYQIASYLNISPVQLSRIRKKIY